MHPIKGNSIVIEPTSYYHRFALKKIANEDTTWQYMKTRGDGENFEKWFFNIMSSANKGEILPLTFLKKENSEVVGFGFYNNISISDERIEIGSIWLSKKAMGIRSIVYEGAYLLYRHAFETFGIYRLELRTDGRNRKAYNLHKRMGATFEGNLRGNAIIQDNSRGDTIVFSVLKSEWPLMSTKLQSSI